MARAILALGTVAAAAAILLVGARAKEPAASQPQAPAADGVFAPTIPQRPPAAGPAPEGMVWIPGGELSMGATAASEGLCELHGVTRDALPVHRVHVDGKWAGKRLPTEAEWEFAVRGGLSGKLYA